MEFLKSYSGEISLALIVGYGLIFKVLVPMIQLLYQQGDNQRQIVRNAGDDAARNDDLLNKVFAILTNTLAKLTDNGERQTDILNEIKTVVKDTNVTVGTLPLTIEQRFNSLEKQLALSQKQHSITHQKEQTTQKIIYWMAKHLDLPIEELRKK